MSREEKSNRCQSKNPAYCRYHGVPAPRCVNTLTILIRQTSASIEEAKRIGNIEKALQLEQEKQKIISELFVLPTVSTETVLINKVQIPSATALEKAKADRKKANKKYLTALANQVFRNNIEKHIALSGTIQDFAYRNAERHNYPIANSLIYRQKEHDYYATTKPEGGTHRVEYDLVRDFAEQNGYDVISARYLPNIDVVVPFRFEDYGITKEEYEKAFQTDDFEERLKHFKEARRRVQRGESIADLAGQAEPNKKEFHIK